jgi:hypothetical protein
MSVTPSTALTRNRSGGVQPMAVSLVMSARSSSTSTRPDQTDPAHRAPVRILVDQPGGGEVHHPVGLVDVQDLPHRPLPGGGLPEQRAGAQVVPVQVAQPSRCEDHSTSSASTRTIGGSVIHWLGSTRVARSR